MGPGEEAVASLEKVQGLYGGSRYAGSLTRRGGAVLHLPPSLPHPPTPALAPLKVPDFNLPTPSVIK